MITSSLLPKIVNYFQKQPEVSLVYLFGSKAKDLLKKGSDIDLAVLFSDPSQNHFHLQGKYIEDLSSLLGIKVDVVNLNASDVVFNYRVVSEGKLVYEKNTEDRILLITDLIHRYFDLKPTYDEFFAELAYRARKGLIGK